MLVIPRRKSQEIIATAPDGSRLRICLIDIHGDKVRIGLECSREWTIHRLEVQQAIDAERSQESLE